jgi:hypothetical protein
MFGDKTRKRVRATLKAEDYDDLAALFGLTTPPRGFVLGCQLRPRCRWKHPPKSANAGGPGWPSGAYWSPKADPDKPDMSVTLTLFAGVCERPRRFICDIDRPNMSFSFRGKHFPGRTTPPTPERRGRVNTSAGYCVAGPPHPGRAGDLLSLQKSYPG